MQKESNISLGGAIILLALFVQNKSLGKDTREIIQWRLLGKRFHDYRRELVGLNLCYNMLNKDRLG